jgi:biopolymer transport protein ExbB
VKKLIVLASSLLIAGSVQAEAPKNLDQLLAKVKKERISKQKELTAREQKFVSAKNKQAALLAQAKKELAALERKTAQLQKVFEKNEKQLAGLEEKLTIASGTLGEMFGVVKQVAGDFKGQFQNSIISAQFPGRDKFMANLAERKKLPAIKELNQLWFEIQREMTESGKVIKFKAPVVTPDGVKTEKEVTRVGAFNLASDGKYLVYQSATNQIIELPRQPQGKFLGMIEDLEGLSSGYSAFGLDPSRGTILSMLVQAPTLGERVDQGGLVGYVILSLLALGLVMVGERIFTLNKEEKKMRAQLKSDEINTDNPIGELMQTFKDFKDKDLETLEMKLDETVLKAAPKITKGINTIKIMSAVAPLLGLLGTVTGMIATFQSITLFGTGDPKLMAGGISTALVTTVLGLVCAIPMLLLHNFVAAKSKGLLQMLEEQSAGLLTQRAEDAGETL